MAIWCMHQLYYEVGSNTVLVMFLRGIVINIDRFKTLCSVATCILHTLSLSCVDGYNTYYNTSPWWWLVTIDQPWFQISAWYAYIVFSQIPHVAVYSSWTAQELIGVIHN